jgi:hypothetical protein
MAYGTKILLALIPLAIVDAVIPIPIVGLILVYVVLARPPWFSDAVDRIYGRAPGRGSSGPTEGSGAS